jgi:hypothetical protein
MLARSLRPVWRGRLAEAAPQCQPLAATSCPESEEYTCTRWRLGGLNQMGGTLVQQSAGRMAVQEGSSRTDSVVPEWLLVQSLVILPACTLMCATTFHVLLAASQGMVCVTWSTCCHQLWTISEQQFQQETETPSTMMACCSCWQWHT